MCAQTILNPLVTVWVPGEAPVTHMDLMSLLAPQDTWPQKVLRSAKRTLLYIATCMGMHTISTAVT